MIYFVIALVFSILVDRYSGRAIEAVRKKAFEQQRQAEYQHPGPQILNNNHSGSNYSKAYDTSGNVSRSYHKNAVEEQKKYQDALFCMTALLFVALISLAWTAVFSTPPILKYLFVWIEVFCLFLLLRKYILSRKLTSSWVRSRAKAELIREARFLSALINKPENDNHDLAGDFTKQASEIAKVIDSAKNQSDLLQKIATTSKRMIDGLHQGEHTLTYGDANSFLHRRIGRQINWFQASSKRLHREVEQSSSLATYIFGITLLLAVLKALLINVPSLNAPVPVEFVTFTLLVFGALSAALVYHSNGRGTGTLSLRYNTQASQILELVAGTSYRSSDSIGNRLSKDDAKEFFRLVAEFESMGNKELVDWALVTERYSAELG